MSTRDNAINHASVAWQQFFTGTMETMRGFVFAGGGGRVGCALGPLTGVFAQGWDYLALIFSLLVSRSRKTQSVAAVTPGHPNQSLCPV